MQAAVLLLRLPSCKTLRYQKSNPMNFSFLEMGMVII